MAKRELPFGIAGINRSIAVFVTASDVIHRKLIVQRQLKLSVKTRKVLPCVFPKQIGVPQVDCAHANLEKLIAGITAIPVNSLLSAFWSRCGPERT